MLYLKLKENLFKGISLDLLGDNIKVALLSQAYVPSDNDEFFEDIASKEVAAVGYDAGGALLIGKTLTTAQGVITFKAEDVIWNITGQMSALYAVIYKDTGNPATSSLIVLKQFIQIRTVINDSYTIEWGSKGILQLR